MTGLAIVIGAVAGVGAVTAWCGVTVATPRVADAITTHTNVARSVSRGRGAGGVWAGLSTRLLGRVGLPTARMRADLAATGTPAEAFLPGLAASTLTGAATPLLVHAASGLLPVWTVLAGAGVGYLVPVAGLRSRAEATRAGHRRALSCLLDVVAAAVAGGAGLDQALHDAAQAGDSAEYRQIRRALATARITGTSAWDALARLGETTGITEYAQLASTVALAGAEGARVRAALSARARTMRAADLAAAEAAASTATEKMSLPVVAMLAAYLVLIGYPAVTAVLTGL